MMRFVLFFASIFAVQAIPPPNVSRLEGDFATPSFRHNRPDVRIIGGNESEPHAYPYQAGIYVTKATGVEFCGGSLVSNNFVLTAAHCTIDAESFSVILGAHEITADEPSQIRLTSTEVSVPSDWDGLFADGSDIALIKLPTPVAENEFIKIVALATGNDTFDGEKAVVAGWGVTSNEQKTVTPKLRYIITDILSNDACAQVDASYRAVMTDSLLCTSGAGPVGTCQGDSGGPLVADGLQVGIVSFGQTDCLKAKPSVFTRANKYIDWIKENSDVRI